MSFVRAIYRQIGSAVARMAAGLLGNDTPATEPLSWRIGSGKRSHPRQMQWQRTGQARVVEQKGQMPRAVFDKLPKEVRAKFPDRRCMIIYGGTLVPSNRY